MRVGLLSEKSTHKTRMQTMDYTRKACVTALPNLVTESQKYAKSSNFWERTFGVLFCEEIVYVLPDFSCQDFKEKARERLKNCFCESTIDHTIFRKRSLRSFNCSFQKIGVSSVSKMAALSSRFVQMCKILLC